MRRLHRISACLLAIGASLGTSDSALGKELIVFAAASLTDALKEIGAAYEDSSGVKVRFNFAASNLLVRQIIAGAPADLFASADESQMDSLETKGLIAEESRISLLSNTLVIVIGAESRLRIRSEADLARPEVQSIALADPQSVPAGIYAKKHLERLGLWKKVRDRVIPTENVRAALAAVEAGNADAAIVYMTDAAISKRVLIAHEVPVPEGPAISYPFAILIAAGDPSAARHFLDYLASGSAREVFNRHGFLPARH